MCSSSYCLRNANAKEVEDKYGRRADRHIVEDDLSERNRDGATVSSSGEEDEDEQGDLVPEALDYEITSTLQAIKDKDRRVYDADATFFSTPGQTPPRATAKSLDQKPLLLGDYQRENLLHAVHGEANETLETFNQQQERMRSDVVRDIHESAADTSSTSDVGAEVASGEAFWVKKQRTELEVRAQHHGMTSLDVTHADRDPETFLTRFLTTRAWVPAASNKTQAFESDDEEEEQRAEEFEETYNLRFEDPQVTNRKINLHSRAAAAASSVRPEPRSKRKRLRQEDSLRLKRAESSEVQERLRLKNLKMEEIASKLARVRDAAGSQGGGIASEEWSLFLSTDWDLRQWDTIMKNHFDESYYTIQGGDDAAPGASGTSERIRKPKWDSQMDISDLIPASELNETPKVHTDGGDQRGMQQGETEDANSMKRSRASRRRQEKLDKLGIEIVAIQSVEAERALNAANDGSSGFRYRETSPTSYGLTMQDILLASDAQLNQYIGLKKLSTFRDPIRKRKDKKRLSKKARLRQWRAETFGASS